MYDTYCYYGLLGSAAASAFLENSTPRSSQDPLPEATRFVANFARQCFLTMLPAAKNSRFIKALVNPATFTGAYLLQIKTGSSLPTYCLTAFSTAVLFYEAGRSLKNSLLTNPAPKIHQEREIPKKQRLQRKQQAARQDRSQNVDMRQIVRESKGKEFFSAAFSAATAGIMAYQLSQSWNENLQQEFTHFYQKATDKDFYSEQFEALRVKIAELISGQPPIPEKPEDPSFPDPTPRPEEEYTPTPPPIRPVLDGAEAVLIEQEEETRRRLQSIEDCPYRASAILNDEKRKKHCENYEKEVENWIKSKNFRVERNTAMIWREFGKRIYAKNLPGTEQCEIWRHSRCDYQPHLGDFFDLDQLEQVEECQAIEEITHESNNYYAEWVDRYGFEAFVGKLVQWWENDWYPAWKGMEERWQTFQLPHKAEFEQWESAHLNSKLRSKEESPDCWGEPYGNAEAYQSGFSLYWMEAWLRPIGDESLNLPPDPPVIIKSSRDVPFPAYEISPDALFARRREEYEVWEKAFMAQPNPSDARAYSNITKTVQEYFIEKKIS